MILTPDGHHDDDHCTGEDCPVCDHDCPGVGCPVCGEPAESAFWTERAITARAMQQIRADVAAGRIPSTVRTFSQLHDYVDANEYGDVCRADAPFDPGTDADVALLNRMQGTINRWLRRGGHRRRGY